MERILAFLIASTGMDGQFVDVITNTNFPGLVVLGLAGIPAMFILVRQMIKFQRDFTDFYILENEKLRARVDVLEEEARTKDNEIINLKNEVGRQRNLIEAHERTIDRLGKIVERRGLT